MEKKRCENCGRAIPFISENTNEAAMACMHRKKQLNNYPYAGKEVPVDGCCDFFL